MLFFLLYKIGAVLALALPVQINYNIAVFVSEIKYFFSFAEKQEMVENLKLVMPNEDTANLRAYSKEIFANFSNYLVDFFRFKKLNLEYIKEHIEIIGKNYVDEALKKGRGAILLSAHLGNWELGGAVVGLLGYPINALALDHNNKLVNDFFIKQRQMKNEKNISINFAIRKCLSALNNNELIAIVGDKDFTNNGAIVKFFGKETLLPKGPAVFHLKTGAVIIPCYLIRVKGDNFRLIFEKPVEYTPSGDFDTDIVSLTGCCAARLEAPIRKYIRQWYCFRKFWLN